MKRMIIFCVIASAIFLGAGCASDTSSEELFSGTVQQGATFSNSGISLPDIKQPQTVGPQ